MSILITGSAGFIGSELCLRLLKRGKKIIGIDNHNNYYDPELKRNRLKRYLDHINYTHLRIDLSDKVAIENAFDQYKPDQIINLAAQAGVRYSIENPLAYINSNIVGFTHILEGCRKHKVKHLIYASSSSVYGANTKMPFSEHDNVNHPLSLYAASKKSNELMAHTYSYLYNLPTTGLRFFTVYGPWGRPDMALYKFVKNIFLGKTIEVYNEGKHVRDFTYIDDVVDAVIKIVKKIPNKRKKNSYIKDPSESYAPFSIVNIGSNKPINLITYISKIEKIIGKKANKKFLNLQKGDIVKTHSSTLKLKKKIKLNKKTTLTEGLSKFVNWYKNYK